MRTIKYSYKQMKKIERTAKKVTGVILPTLYLAPMFLGAYGFIYLCSGLVNLPVVATFL